MIRLRCTNPAHDHSNEPDPTLKEVLRKCAKHPRLALALLFIGPAALFGMITQWVVTTLLHLPSPVPSSSATSPDAEPKPTISGASIHGDLTPDQKAQLFQAIQAKIKELGLQDQIQAKIHEFDKNTPTDEIAKAIQGDIHPLINPKLISCANFRANPDQLDQDLGPMEIQLEFDNDQKFYYVFDEANDPHLQSQRARRYMNLVDEHMEPLFLKGPKSVHQQLLSTMKIGRILANQLQRASGLGTRTQDDLQAFLDSITPSKDKDKEEL
jgi:hypothetical protein